MFMYNLTLQNKTVNPKAYSLMIKNIWTKSFILAWATTEQVSVECEQVLDDGDKLGILVEKDFACLAPREGEDESDMYAHPNAEGDGC